MPIAEPPITRIPLKARRALSERTPTGGGLFECIGQGRSAWCRKAELSCELIQKHQGGLPVSHVPKTPLGGPLQLIETTQPEFEALGVPKTSDSVEKVRDDFSGVTRHCCAT